MAYEKLPAETAETCDQMFGVIRGVRQKFGYSGTPGPDRCGKKADWIDRSTCNCGQCDMTFRLCDQHKKESEEERRKFERDYDVQKLPGGLTAIRPKGPNRG